MEEESIGIHLFPPDIVYDTTHTNDHDSNDSFQSILDLDSDSDEISSSYSRDQMQSILKQYPFKETNAHNDGKPELKVKSDLQHFITMNQPMIWPIINAGYFNIAGEVNNGYQTIQQPTPLQYFVSSMQTTSTKRKDTEIEDIWQCIKLLLENGALPPSYFEHEHVSKWSIDNESYSLRIVHEFRKLMMEHITNEHVIYERLQFFMSAIQRNCKQTMLQEPINRSIITYHCYDRSVWIMSDLYAEQHIDDGIPSPKLFEFYLKQQWDILHLFDCGGYLNGYDYLKMTMHRIPYLEKESMIKYVIKEEMKNKRSFVKYLLAFREFVKIFRMERIREFAEILMEIEMDLYVGDDLIDLLLSFIYDDMHYLRYDTIEQDREFVNESLKMYSYLSNKWKTWLFNNYILKIPKSELVKLDSFAYLCYL